MQKRYCSCGQSIWVDYQFFGAMCSARFMSEAVGEARENAFSRSGALLECPHCRSLLSINTLF